MIDGYEYYFDYDGILACYDVSYDGYLTDDNGIKIDRYRGFQTITVDYGNGDISDNTYYFYFDGRVCIEPAKYIDGIWYCFNSNGVLGDNDVTDYNYLTGPGGYWITGEPGLNYICGDETSDIEDGLNLIASRVVVCAGHQAHAILKIIQEKEGSQ